MPHASPHAPRIESATARGNRDGSYSFVAGPLAPRSGRSSGCIHRYGNEIYGLLDQKTVVPPQWIGKTARLSRWLRTEDTDGAGGALLEGWCGSIGARDE